MEPREVRIGDGTALVEIDDPESPTWKGAVVDWNGADVEDDLFDKGEVVVHLLDDGGGRISRARVVRSPGAYEPEVLEGLEAFH
jgi:hypothetical protein